MPITAKGRRAAKAAAKAGIKAARAEAVGVAGFAGPWSSPVSPGRCTSS